MVYQSLRSNDRRLFSQKNNLSDQNRLFPGRILLLNRGSYRARGRAGAALDAGFRVDFILAVAFGDRAYRAVRRTGTAADAFIGDFVSHIVTSVNITFCIERLVQL